MSDTGELRVIYGLWCMASYTHENFKTSVLRKVGCSIVYSFGVISIGNCT